MILPYLPQTPPVSGTLQAPAPGVRASDLPDGLRAVALNSGTDVSSMFLLGMRGGGEDPTARLAFSAIGAVLLNPAEFEAAVNARSGWVRGWTLDLSSLATSAPSPDLSTARFVETWVNVANITTWSPRPEVTKEAFVHAPKPKDPLEQFAAPAAPTAAAVASSPAANPPISRRDSARRARFRADAAALIAGARKRGRYPASFALGEGSVYNGSLAGRRFEGGRTLLLMWQTAPAKDGKRSVAYADGTVSLLSSECWKLAWSREAARRKGR